MSEGSGEGADGDEGGIGVAHGDMGLAEADLDGFAERGAADDLDQGTGHEPEFAEAGEAGFGTEEVIDDSGSADGEVCEGGWGHSGG